MIEGSLKRWVLDAYEAGDHKNINGVWYNYECPICEANGKTPRPTLGLNTAEGWFHCFRCGAGGKAREVLEQALIEVLFDEEALAESKKPVLPNGFVKSAPGMVSWEYLRSRKVPKRVIEEAMLGEAPGHPRYRGRVIVPWWSWKDALAGFAARAIPGEDVNAPESKYLYPKGMRRSDYYLAEEIFADSPDPCFLVEGSFDALAVWPNGVALGGGSPYGIAEDIATVAFLGTQQIRRPLIIALDADQFRRNEFILSSFRRSLPGVATSAIVFPEGVKDLGDLMGKPKAIRALIESVTTVVFES